jgi:DNA-binding transcriptional ArsR family regulator
MSKEQVPYTVAGMQYASDEASSVAAILRQEIVALLERSKRLTAGDISVQTGLPRPIVLKHLRLLRQAGIVRTGKHRCFKTYELTVSGSQSMTERLRIFEEEICPAGLDSKEREYAEVELFMKKRIRFLPSPFRPWIDQ